MSRLKNKVAIVTGATKGLGFEVAKKYHQNGAKLALCSRSINDLIEVRDCLAGFKNDSDILIAQVDISKSDEVTNFIENTKKRFGSIDILFNNAGVYGPKGFFESGNLEEWVKAIEINLIGSAYVLRAVTTHMKQQKSGKIIQVAGGGAAGNFPRFSAYATSKVGVVRLSEILSSELKEFGVDVNSIAPGFLKTRLLDEVLNSTPEIVGVDFYEKCLALKKTNSDCFHMPSELALFLASNESNGITGKFISAIWDAWNLFPNHLPKLMNSEIYTLRRIIGKDRNMDLFDL